MRSLNKFIFFALISVLILGCKKEKGEKKESRNLLKSIKVTDFENELTSLQLTFLYDENNQLKSMLQNGTPKIEFISKSIDGFNIKVYQLGDSAVGLKILTTGNLITSIGSLDGSMKLLDVFRASKNTIDSVIAGMGVFERNIPYILDGGVTLKDFDFSDNGYSFKGKYRYFTAFPSFTKDTTHYVRVAYSNEKKAVVLPMQSLGHIEQWTSESEGFSFYQILFFIHLSGFKIYDHSDKLVDSVYINDQLSGNYVYHKTQNGDVMNMEYYHDRKKILSFDFEYN